MEVVTSSWRAEITFSEVVTLVLSFEGWLRVLPNKNGRGHQDIQNGGTTPADLEGDCSMVIGGLAHILQGQEEWEKSLEG